MTFPHSDFDQSEQEISDLVDPMYNSGKWPSSLLEMITCTPDGSIFDVLPKGLTSFTSRKSSYRAEMPGLQPTQIQGLPRGLTTLHVVCVDWHNIDVSTWPSTLTNLRVQFETFNLNHCCLLPRSLKSFSAGGIDKAGDGDDKVDALNNLEFEALCARGRESLSSDERWPSIKLDILRYNSTVPRVTLNAYIESIESGRFFGLPLTLTSLTWPDLPLKNNVKLLLPPRITEFIHKQDGHCPKPLSTLRFLVDAFPPNSCARFETSKTHLVIEDLDASPTDCGLCNSSITSLTLFTAFSLSERLFESLPRHLPKLDLTNHRYAVKYYGISSASLNALPPNLKSFSFWGTFDDGISRWVHYLPRTLETLCTPSMIIAGCYISELPQKLTSLSCSCFEVSLPQVLDLPRTLSFVYVERCGGHESTLLRHCLTLEAWNTLIRTYRPFWRIWEAGLQGATAKLSIASKTWPATSETHHYGALDLLSVIAEPKPSWMVNVPPSDSEHGYYGENVEKLLKHSRANSA